MILFNKSSDEITDGDRELVKRIKQFYFGKEGDGSSKMTMESITQLIEMIGDAYTFGPNEYFGSLISSQSAQPLYAYSFNYYGNWRFGDLIILPLMKMIQQLLMSIFGLKVWNHIYIYIYIYIYADF